MPWPLLLVIAHIYIDFGKFNPFIGNGFMVYCLG